MFLRCRKSILRNLWLYLFSHMVLLIPIETNAQDILWGKAKVGMSIDELRKTYPDSILLKTPGTDEDDIHWMLRIGYFEVSSIPINVELRFVDQKLRRVRLVVNWKPRAGESDFRSYVGKLSTLLRTKYGESTSHSGRDDEVMLSTEQTWVSNGLRVTLTGYHVGPTIDPSYPSSMAINSLFIEYDRELGKELDELEKESIKL